MAGCRCGARFSLLVWVVGRDAADWEPTWPASDRCRIALSSVALTTSVGN